MSQWQEVIDDLEKLIEKLKGGAKLDDVAHTYLVCRKCGHRYTRGRTHVCSTDYVMPETP